MRTTEYDESTVDEQACALLEEAAAGLSEHEWCQSYMARDLRDGLDAIPMFDDNIALCALGAIAAALEVRTEARPATDRFQVAVKRLATHVRTDDEFCRRLTDGQVVGVDHQWIIATWNDDPARSKEDVVLALKQAATDDDARKDDAA